MKLHAPLAVLLLAAGSLGAQEGQGPAPGPAPGPKPPTIDDLLAPKDDPRAELVRLFHKVERHLEEISDVLYEAGAGREGLDEVPDSGLDDLLRATGEKSGQVVQDIDRILRIAEELAQQGQSGSGSGAPPSGESPLNEPGQGAPRQREQTPQGPRPEEQGGDQPETQKPPGQEGQPDSRKENPEGGENRPGDPDQHESGQAVPRADDKDRWGMLPERVRETFRNQGRDDLPVQYREWIDAYYRRLNERPR